MIYPLQHPYNADLIIERGNATFICHLNPELSTDKTRKQPITSQNCWRIIRIEEEKETGIIRQQYPYGDACNYDYAPDNINDYSFEFRK